MGDMLKDASDWLEDKRKEHASSAVTYHRGTFQVAVQATIGRTVFEIDNGFGILEKTESRDYLILAEDLVLNTVRTLPQRGDRIREADGETVYVYEVLAPGKEPHYRFSDPYRKTLRIHTKQIDTEVT